jgi:beta-glucanase (GH16 family)
MQELAWVLQHPDIARSPNTVRFLSFICNRYFEGESGDIREYTIAVEALGRKASSFDSHADPIVRVTARALRKKLQEIYNGEEGKSRSLQIVLPLGHYVPQFVRRSPGDSNPDRPGLPDGPPLAENPSAEGAGGGVPVRRDTFFTRANAVIAAHRQGILKSAVVLMGLAGVFVAGFFLGQHSDHHPQLVGDSLQWGEPVWGDEFNASVQQPPDPEKWAYDTGNQNGWGNHEIEVYCSPLAKGARPCDPRRPNAFQDGAGHLVLRAEKTADGTWTSARMTTRGLKEFQYGRIEARMKLPVGSGFWPSFWMLGSNFNAVGWPASGSVDIAENVSLTPEINSLGPGMIRSTLHGPRYFGGNGLWHDFRFRNGARVDDPGFHTYGIIWSPGMIQFYVDDPANVFFVQDASDLPEGGEWAFDHPFWLFLNLAIGGAWAGEPNQTTPNPADMLVDYVHVYIIPSIPAPSIQWQAVAVTSGSTVVTPVSLQARSYAGRVHLACSTEPATVACSLATSIVNFSNTLSQEDTLTLSTESFSDKGKIAAPPGRYKLTITATTISGDHSQVTVPFEVKGG